MSKSSNVNIMALFTVVSLNPTRWRCANTYLHLPVTSWPPNLLCKLHFYTTIDIDQVEFQSPSLSNYLEKFLESKFHYNHTS